MTNLLKETTEDIEESGHGTGDVLWVGSANGTRSLGWEEFAAFAGSIKYDSGYGGAEIPEDLVVVFSDGSWLQRGEYDGSEWWDFCKTPVRQGDAQRFKLDVKPPSRDVTYATAD